MPWQPCTASSPSVLPYMVMMLHAFSDVPIIIMYKKHALLMPHAEFDLTHDGSSQFWFSLIQAQDITHLSPFAVFRVRPLVCSRFHIILPS